MVTLYTLQQVIVCGGFFLFMAAIIMRLALSFLALSSQLNLWYRLFFTAGGVGGLASTIIVAHQENTFGFFRLQPPAIILIVLALGALTLCYSALIGKIKTANSHPYFEH